MTLLNFKFFYGMSVFVEFFPIDRQKLSATSIANSARLEIKPLMY